MAECIILLQALTPGEESVLEVSKKFATTLEARQIRLAHKHHLDKNDHLFCVGLEGHKTSRHAIPKLTELPGVLASHDIKHLLGQFKWRRLEFEALARCV